MSENISNDHRGVQPDTERNNASLPDSRKKDNRSGKQQKNMPLAKDPSIKKNELADPSATPDEKKISSGIPGAESEDNIGTAARGAAAGTKGASGSSEGRKGDPANYGTNQFGPGLATGPAPVTPGPDKNIKRD